MTYDEIRAWALNDGILWARFRKAGGRTWYASVIMRGVLGGEFSVTTALGHSRRWRSEGAVRAFFARAGVRVAVVGGDLDLSPQLAAPAGGRT